MQHGNANAVALGNWQVNCNDVPSFQDALWVQYSPHLAELAECITEADKTTYRCVEGSKMQENIKSYIYVVTSGKKNFIFANGLISGKISGTIIQEDNLQKWTKESLQLSATPYTIIILKYGLAIQNKDQFNAFSKCCFQPAQQDKSGNAIDEMHCQVIEQLKKMWGSQLSSKNITWRIWAGFILELPAHQHKRAIENPPPINVLNLFHCIPSNEAQQLNQVRQVASFMLQKSLHNAESALKVCNARYEVLEHVFTSHMCLSHGFFDSMHAIEISRSSETFQEILLADDIDHVENFDNAM
ncbi:hypothetical protein HK096_011163, partial [Nowakowskiella sp. JEL0078]